MAHIYDKATYDQMYSCPGWQHGMRNHSKCPRHHYNWFVETQLMSSRQRMHRDNLLAHPNFNKYRDIAIIGGGFGWCAELLVQQNPRINVVNLEISEHVLGSINTSEEEDLRNYLIEDGHDPDDLEYFMHPDQTRTLSTNEIWAYWLRPDKKRSTIEVIDNDLKTAPQRNDLHRRMNNKIDAIVTEVSLDSMATEDEIDNYLDAIEQAIPGPNCEVIHLTEFSGAPDLGNISKTAEDWRVYLDDRGFRKHRVIDVREADNRKISKVKRAAI